MQKGYFKIGDDKNRKLVTETTYGLGISAEKGAFSANKGPDERKHLVGSVNFGSNQTSYQSEA